MFLWIHLQYIFSGMLSADGFLGLSQTHLIIISCAIALLILIVTVTAVIKYSERKKRREASVDTKENHNAPKIGEDLWEFEIIRYSYSLLQAELTNKYT